MSYLVLARKSRPQTFAEVIGQKPIVRTLQNALQQGRVPHALLFCGVRGTGKTTLARIMGKALNCAQGPAPEPCNVCTSCREITQGNSIDLQEVDGASNRGIQEIRELKEKLYFMPGTARHKIILIDEVHMLTTEAFNALLKTLEEPPAHVYFMFATTEPHKVPLTILSRCQRYELKRLNRQDLSDHFYRLAAGEGVQLEPEAMEMIVREASGSVRDGLSLLDQVFSYCGPEVSAQEVGELLGLAGRRSIAALAEALLAGNLAAVYRHIEALYLQAVDIRRLSNDLLHWFRLLLLCKLDETGSSLDECSAEEQAELRSVAAGISLEYISGLFQILLEGFDQAALSPHPRLAFEMVFIRAIRLPAVAPLSVLIRRFDTLLAASSVDGNSKPVVQPEQSCNSIPEHSATAPDGSHAVSSKATPLPTVATPKTVPATPVPAQSASTTVSLQQEKTHQTEATEAPTLTTPTPSPVRQAKTEPLPEPAAEPDAASTVQSEAQHAEPALAAPLPGSPSSPQAETLSANRIEQKTDQAASPAQTTAVTVETDAQTEERRQEIRERWPDFLQYINKSRPWIVPSLQLASYVECTKEELLIHFADQADCTVLKQQDNIKALAEFLLDFFQEDLRIRLLLPDSAAGCAPDPQAAAAPQQERRALSNEPLVLAALDIFNGQVDAVRMGAAYRKKESPPSSPTTPSLPRQHLE